MNPGKKSVCAPKEEEDLPLTQNAQLHQAGLPACDVSA